MIKTQQRKGRWMADEDNLLINLVNKYIDGEDVDWAVLEQHFNGTRDSKQIRERWVNHLNPNIKKRKFNDQEIEIIEVECSKHKFKWARIAKKIPNATPLMIKNFYNNRLKKKNPANKKLNNTATISYTHNNFNNITTVISPTTTTTKTKTTTNLITNTNQSNNNLNDNCNYYNNDEYSPSKDNGDINYYSKSNLIRNNSNRTDRTDRTDRTFVNGYHTTLSRTSSISSTKTVVDPHFNTTQTPPSSPSGDDMKLYTLATMAEIADKVSHSGNSIKSPPTDFQTTKKMAIPNLLNEI